MLVNGALSNSISANDRGLLYGDGVFRTMRLSQGIIQHWPRHYQKLQQDCAAILLDCPASGLLTAELEQLVTGHVDGVVRIVITRGTGGRGFAQPASQASSRILSLMPPQDFPEYFRTKGIKAHVCNLRLAHQPRLAGIKHLNRLENVLAAAEWNNAEAAEGILLDIEGNVIEGTRSNLFMISDSVLITPELSRCGVAGMQRERVMEWAAIHDMPCKVEQFSLDKLLDADEFFLVNSVIGLWPVHEMHTRIWANCPVAGRIQKWLEQEVT